MMRSRILAWLCPGILALTLATDALAKVPAPEEKVQFNRDIRPILSNHCFACHGPDEKQRKGDLRLDTAEGARAGQVLVPGKSEASSLYQRITARESHLLMPPARANKPLAPEQVELIKRWIDQGAEYQGHWAFVTARKPEVPRVQRPQWSRTPIDRFILARLEREGLSPSDEADRRTLIRRVTFDLTGLPPTPAEVEAFVRDSSPNAYEKVVDRLLASPHHGEHMTRYWMDAVRYGDTHGLHLDNYREMWPYRDWVIRAFNSNMPFDRFTVEQIAGDLLPSPSRDQLVASGYNRNHVSTSEGGSIAEEVYVRNVVDMVDTTSTVWMGLTAGCAVCHDHKFDPLTQKEYYKLFAFFNSMDGSPLDGNKKDPAPVIRVPTPGQERELASLAERLAGARQQLEKREKSTGPAYEKWLAAMASRKDRKQDVISGLVARYSLDETGGAGVSGIPGEKGKVVGPAGWKPGKLGGAFESNGSRYIELASTGDFERDQAFSYGAWVKWNGGAGGMSPLSRMNDRQAYRGWDLYLINGQVAAHIIHRWNNDALKVTTQARLKPNTWSHLFVTYDGSSQVSGLKVYIDGKLQQVDVNERNLKGTIRCQTPLRIGRRNPSSPFLGLIDEVRIYARELTAEEVGVLAGADPLAPLLATPAQKRTPEQKRALEQYYLRQHDPVYGRLQAEIDQLTARQAALQTQMPTTMVMKEMATPRPAYLLLRGAYDQRGDQVERGTPTFLPPLPEGAPQSRLGFAQWLVDPAHPLTARVQVNRLWQQLFGTGIVKTPEDFGVQGEWPSHPELLDWLAVQMIEDGWDTKKTLKRMVLSAVYRQSSRITPALLARDPENRLLARGPRFRLDAEMIRDNALAVSGLLNRKLGGPSVKPPQPSGLWEAVGYSSSNTARFKADTGEKVFRRGVYTFWKRTSPPPQMTTFDAPSRESCTMRRERTNTPLQALLLMNEVQAVEAARCLAQRLLLEGGATAPERATLGFLLTMARPPSADELVELLNAQKDFLTVFQSNPEEARKLITVGETAPETGLDPAELAAWTLTASMLLNLDEVLNKN